MGGTQALGLALGGPSELPGTTAWLLNITVTDVRASAPATVCRAQLKQLPFLCSAPFGVALMRSSPQGPGGPQVQEDNGNTMATLTQVDLSSPGEWYGQKGGSAGPCSACQSGADPTPGIFFSFFSCVGASLLCGLFSSCSKWQLLSSCGFLAVASLEATGFRALGLQ